MTTLSGGWNLGLCSILEKPFRKLTRQRRGNGLLGGTLQKGDHGAGEQGLLVRVHLDITVLFPLPMAVKLPQGVSFMAVSGFQKFLLLSGRGSIS